MRRAYPIICVRCKIRLTTNVNKICDKCLTKESSRKNIYCPNCSSLMDRKIIFISGKRFFYYKCGACGYVVFDKSNVNGIVSISDIRKILN